MASPDAYSANFGPMSVRGRKTGAGPTVSVYVGDREPIRMDLFQKNPHYHLNPYISDHAVDTVITVDGITTPLGLLEHLLESETLRVLANQAGEPGVARWLTPANEAEVNRFIAILTRINN